MASTALLVFLYIAIHIIHAVNLGNLTCCKESGTSLDCANCNLVVFPGDFIRNKTELTTLDLSNNNMSHIPDGSFQNFKSLRRLVLTDNPVMNYNKETFKGLEALTHLEMGIANLPYTPPRLAVDTLIFIQSLEVLRLYYRYGTEFEPACLVGFTTLQTLEISNSEEPLTNFGEEFTGLLNLRSLIIRNLHYTDIYFDITDETFENVPYLEELQISHRVQKFSLKALTHFTQLSTLSLLCNRELQAADVFNAIKNMKKPTLTTLILDGSNYESMLYLSADLVDSPNFSKITHLSLKFIHLVKVDFEIFSNMRNVRYVAAGYNSIVPNNLNESLKDIVSQSKIETLDVSFLFRPFPLSRQKFIDTYCRNTKHTFRRPPSFLNLTVSESSKGNSSMDWHVNGIWTFLPPTVRYVFASHLMFESENQHVYRVGENNVQYIDFSNSLITRCPLVLGLDKLQGIDISYGKIQNVNRKQLFQMPSLKYLNISHNNLHDKNVNAFLKGGIKLEWLDLGHNQLKNISLSLQNMTAIQYLSLSGNPLSHFMVSFGNNTHLRKLDFSNCLMISLPLAVTEQIDDLQSRLNLDLNVDLSGNRFECSCDTMEMIRWIQNTQVNILDRSELMCSLKNSSVVLVKIDLELMSKSCQHRQSLILHLTIPIGIGCTFLASFLIAYRYKLRLRFYVHKGRKHIKNLLPSTEGTLLEDINTYDVFVVYNESHDYEWVENELIPKISDEWGFSFCAARTFDSGSVFVNCETAISSSRKIVLVLTPEYAADEWCRFEMEMIVTAKRDQIIVICKDEVASENLSGALLALIESGHVEYSQEHVALQLFWRNLHDKLLC